MMKFHAMGMNYRHNGDFEIIRPSGTGDNLLLIFKTAAELEIDGNSVQVLPDSAVLYSVGTPQIYRAIGDLYINHWIHMDCCENDDFHLTTGLNFNKAVKLTNTAEAEDIMRMIGREELSELPSKEQYMDLLIRMLLLKVGDGCRGGSSAETPNPHRAALTMLRAEIYNSAGQFSSIEELAARINLSPSYFQRLYKDQFGVSCYEDLLSARTKAACYYLKNTDMSVKEVAAACGYENDVCFMRRFRQRTGLTPTEYRIKN
ncbi:MAG: AraC family transcriptional regulator [Oscillospiraceae bacterium]|nr:AraC family transcriptional regulator [Oscillospiraceae bacterium]